MDLGQDEEAEQFVAFGLESFSRALALELSQARSVVEREAHAIENV